MIRATLTCILEAAVFGAFFVILVVGVPLFFGDDHQTQFLPDGADRAPRLAPAITATDVPLFEVNAGATFFDGKF